jgi:tetratricopeptide (TPR) repeat protein
MLPESPSLLIQLASRYIDANKLAGAEDALRHALELFPNEARVYVRLGYVYLRQDKLELAIPISEKGLSLAEFANRRRDRAYAHLNLARAYGRQGDLDLAFEHLAEAREYGITSFAEVKSDPQLGALRADPRYKMGGY